MGTQHEGTPASRPKDVVTNEVLEAALAEYTPGAVPDNVVTGYANGVPVAWKLDALTQEQFDDLEEQDPLTYYIRSDAFAFIGDSSGLYLARPSTEDAGEGALYTCTNTDAEYCVTNGVWEKIRCSGLAAERLADPPSTGWETTGSPTIGVDRDARVMDLPSAAGWKLESRALTPSTGYVCTAIFEAAIPIVHYCFTGLALFDGTKLLSFGPGYSSATGNGVISRDYNTTTSFAATNFGREFPSSASARVYRIIDDNANRLLQVSPNGHDWIQLLAESRTTHLTPTRIGWGGENQSGIAQKLRLRSFDLRAL